MAELNILGTEVEEHVRAALSDEFGIGFAKRSLPLKSGGTFSFDAVSADGRIVVSIKASRAVSRGGNRTTGASKAALADLYFLSLVDAERRMLATTDRGFFDRLSHDLRGRLAPGLELKHVPLPPELEQRVQSALDRASNEMRSKSDVA